MLSGVTVQIGDNSANTNNNGVYTITEVSVGSHIITAAKTGYQTYSDTVVVSKGTTVIKNIQITPDGIAPSNTTVSNFINDGASSASSILVTLSISASDNVGVTGYYASESSAAPLPNVTGWISITSTSIYSSTVSFSLSSGSGTKTVYIWFRDLAGNVSASASDSITLSISDTTAPSNPAVLINNNEASTNSISVTLSISASEDTGVTGYCAKESSTTPDNNDTCWTSVTSTTSYSATISFTLSSGSGTKTVYVWFKDTAGNISASANDNISLTVSDTTAPSSPTISINGGATSTTSTSATLNLSAADDIGITGYCTKESSTTPDNNDTCWTSVTSATSYSATVSFTLSSGNLGDNTKTVYAWFRDSAGNVSSSANDSITLTISDSTAPSSPSISINNGDTSTTSTSVTLTISAADDVGVSGYCVKESSTTPSSSDLCWTSVTSTTSYSATISFTLSSGNLGDNTKTVYIWFRDSAGNISARVNDTITLTVSDATSPTSPSVSINNGDTSTTSTSVTLTISAVDDVGVTGYCTKESSTTPSGNDTCWANIASIKNYSATVSFTLSSGSLGDNTKTVHVWFRDSAGNVSSSASDTITLTISDSTVPSSPSVSINNGDASTTSTSVTLTLSATDDVGVTAYYASESSATPASTSGWTSVTSATSYSATVNFTLSGGSVGNNAKTVYVWFRDTAGNISTSASDSITLTISDSTVPSSPSISINNGDTSTTSTSATLTLSATDNVGVTGYCAKETSTTPLTNDTCWTSVTSATSYSASVSFTLSSGSGTKTVYVWFRDAAGNISASANDSITLFTYLMGGSIQGKSLNLTSTNAAVTTLAGSAGVTGSTDATGSSARFYYPTGVTTDGTNLYIADDRNQTIRKIVISTGAVTTIAGSAGLSGSTDGTGSAARFNSPRQITTDGTNLFVTDHNSHTIRKIVISTGAVTTLAGSAGSSGSTDGTGSAARFYNPRGITTDGVNLYIAESGNHTIRKIVISTGVVTTLAGSAGLSGSTDGTGSSARFYYPNGITTDGTNLYVGDTSNNTIRKIVISTGVVTTIAGSAGNSGSTDGTGSSARFYYPETITTDGTNLFVGDDVNNTIRKVVILTGEVTTLAGSAGNCGSTDGTGSTSRFCAPRGITTDGINIFVGDTEKHTIRRIGPLMGGAVQGKPLNLTNTVTTFAGLASNSGSTDATGTSARFNNPNGITTDGTNLFIAETSNHTIRKVVTSTGVVTTLAGLAGYTGSTDGTGTAARFNWPDGITTDGTNLFVTESVNHTIRKIAISTGDVTTLAGSAGISGSTDGTGAAARFNSPRFITTDGANLFVAEHDNHTIRKIVISTGAVTTIAGSAGITGSTDGTGTVARFNTPYGIVTDGTNLFITELYNHTIRKMVISTGVVTTIAGSAGNSGSTDGTGTSARFNQPAGITTDGTNLFISDYGNHTIRKMVIATGAVTTIAGSAGLVATTDGVGSAARFNYPRGITTDGTSLFETDYWGYTIRRIQ